VPGSRQAGRGDGVAHLREQSRVRLIAALVLALALAGAYVPPASGEGGEARLQARPAPPTSTQIEVPAREAIGKRALRRDDGGVPTPASSSARRLFPDVRLVAVYGAPQLDATIVGQNDPTGAATEATRLASRFTEVSFPAAQAAIDLIATVATADPGPSGLYRSRQDPALIQSYLDATRSAGGRLVLDVQPGRSKFIREVKALEPFLLQPDVDVALDPEWNVGRKGVPGVTPGSVSAKQINKVARYLAGLVESNGLPQKALFVHQFREGSVNNRERVHQRGGAVAVTLNFDGIGSPAPKIAGYRALSQPGLFNGFSIFVSRDNNVMGFRRIAALVPPPDYVMYQ
jgi:hypothetical protein